MSPAVTHLRLAHEAGMLASLLAQHVNDRRQSASTQPALIHFVDSHELTAFINANEGNYLDGFMLDVEKNLLDEQHGLEDLRWQIRFKAEQIQRWLLMKHPLPIVLLPCHAEEIDEEIAYQDRQRLRRQLGLMSAARAQWLALKTRGLANKVLTQYLEEALRGSSQSKRFLVDLLSETAPAVASLLWPTPDTVERRIGQLTNESQLYLLADVPWEDFGFTPELCERVRCLSADPATVEHWRQRLNTTRSNSSRSNQIDSEALAYLAAFNLEMSRAHRACRGVLVTRASSLIHLAVEAQHGPDAHGGGLVRHTRLLVGDRLDDPAKEAPADQDTDPVDQSLLQLKIALGAYERSLAEQDSSGQTEPAAEARRLVHAWSEFEATRFTMKFSAGDEAPPDTAEPLPDNDDLLRLVRWLKDEDDAETLILQQLDRSVSTFRRETLPRLSDSAKTPARLSRSARPQRVLVQPLVGCPLGPLEFSARAIAGGISKVLADASAVVIELTDRLVEPNNIAEDYLYSALVMASQGRWKLTEIYADCAILSSRLLGAGAVEVEARLLAAQALRYAGAVRDAPHSPEPGHKTDRSATFHRLVRAHRMLADAQGVPANDVRWLVEGAAQNLECLLLVEPGGGDIRASLELGLNSLRHAHELAPADAWQRLQILALSLTYHYASRFVLQLAAPEPEGLLNTVREAHRQLIELITELRQASDGSAESLPAFARALEIIGYDLRRVCARDAGHADEAEPDLPSGLLSQLDDLPVALAGRTDCAGQLIAGALAQSISRVGSYKDYALVYAPVWERNDAEVFEMDLPAGPLRDRAVAASRVVNEAGHHQLVFKGDPSARRLLQNAADEFDSVIEQIEPSTSVARLLSMERCYARLLLARSESDKDRQLSRFKQLDRDYRELIADQPDSAALRFRHGVVLAELGRHDEAFEALSQAMQTFDNQREAVSDSHWVRSTMARRMGHYFASKAREQMDRLKAQPEHTDLRKLYLHHMMQAFRIVFRGFQDQHEKQGPLARLEHRRSMNNVVYYAAAYVDGGGNVNDLDEHFSRRKWLSYLSRLHPLGLHQVAEWNLLHTIGYAYHVAGERDLAKESADHLLNALAGSGATTDSASIRNALDDALTWKRLADALG